MIALLKDLKLGSPPEPNLIGISTLEDKKNGMYFEFTPKKFFEKTYGVPKSTFQDSSDELILLEVTFDNDFAKNKKLFEIPLPYHLQTGDSADRICQKLDKKPDEKSKSNHYDEIQHDYYFYKDDFKILIKLDCNLNLLWFRIGIINLSEKYKMKLKQSLSEQNKNLSSDNIPLVVKQKENSPVRQWEKRTNDGDSLHTPQNIALTKKIVEQFIDQLSDATQLRNATKVYAAIKKVVLAFNKNSSFIETLEREELVGFIHASVRLTGFVLDDNIDLTEQWREW
jgi:hypothetical protein